MKRARTSSTQDAVTSSQLVNMPASTYRRRTSRPRMPWTPYKKKSTPRRAVRTGAPRGSGSGAQSTDFSIRVLNPYRPPDFRIQRTVPQSLCYGFSNGGINAAFIFDPSGTFGNTSSLGTPQQMQDWTALIALYDHYKVNSITVNLNYETQGSVLGPVPVLMNRNYERSVTTSSAIGISALTRTVEKSFSPTSARHTFTFKPRVNPLVDNTGVIATEAREVRDMDWTDVNFPAELFGFQVFSPYVLAATQFLYMEVTYDLSFRYSK